MCIRKPKTTQERRHTQSRDGYLMIDDYRVKIRSRRNSQNLPTSWDDLISALWRHRSWKRHRRNQWRN